MAIKIQNDTVIYDDKVFKVGAGTTANRPASPAQGMVRYNTDTSLLENYSGTAWVDIGDVTLSGTQTLTNKTLSNPILTLGGSQGTAGQALISQGAGQAPTWGSAGVSTGKAIAMAMIFGF